MKALADALLGKSRFHDAYFTLYRFEYVFRILPGLALTNASLGKPRYYDTYFILYLGTFFVLLDLALIKALANLILPLARTYENLLTIVPNLYLI